MCLILFYYLLLVSNGHCKNEESVEYYVNLIQREIARASTYQLTNNSYAYRPLNNTDKEYGTFDYIVVGSGAAGAIIASRLSENPTKSVLLIEAGTKETDFTDIPAMSSFSRLEYSWNYYTIPQTKSCLAFQNQQCRYVMGKGLGGSTVINALIYSRGVRRDYDNWYNQGNSGWAFQNVLPFFKKTENSKINGDAGYHGFSGKINVEYERPDTMSLHIFLEANRELNRHIGDYNGKNPLTVGKVQFNTIQGRRGSTGRAFLRPNFNRQNLKILTESYATHILLNNKTAYGIRFAKDQKYFVAKSRKEVIISAGPIGSPYLLMLSGIGPNSHLQDLNIPVKQDLPVGANLKNHFSYINLNFLFNWTDPQESLEDLVRDYLQSKGPLTNTVAVLALGFVQTNVSKIPGHPDIELVLSKHPSNPYRGFSIEVTLMHPKSTGSIKLRSKDPFDYPLIDSNAFTDADDEDIETIYQGIQLSLDLLNTKAFRSYNTSLDHKDLPACKNFTHLSKAYWYCHIKQSTIPFAHSTGTCKMGAVVTNKLKVYGIKNLRVADASVIPGTISGHTSAPAMMIGEKAAHMMRFG